MLQHPSNIVDWFIKNCAKLNSDEKWWIYVQPKIWFLSNFLANEWFKLNLFSHSQVVKKKMCRTY